MKNREKYKEKIEEIGGCLRIAKVNGELVDCFFTKCGYCEFHDRNRNDKCCYNKITEWLEQESGEQINMKNFKVKCVDDKGGAFTFGKTYEVKNGRITHDIGIESDVKFKNVDELNEAYVSQFELVKEKKMSKFKVGDRVRVRRDRGENWNQNGEMDIYCGNIKEIGEVTPAKNYHLKDGGHWIFCEKDLTLVEENENNMFRKEDLKSGMLVEIECCSDINLCLVIESALGLCISGKELWCPVSYLDENLINKKIRITKVFDKTVPMYAHELEVRDKELLWQRKEVEEVKELTMKEIEEKYGCKVKIVKGE